MFLMHVKLYAVISIYWRGSALKCCCLKEIIKIAQISLKIALPQKYCKDIVSLLLWSVMKCIALLLCRFFRNFYYKKYKAYKAKDKIKGPSYDRPMREFFKMVLETRFIIPLPRILPQLLQLQGFCYLCTFVSIQFCHTDMTSATWLFYHAFSAYDKLGKKWQIPRKKGKSNTG